MLRSDERDKSVPATVPTIVVTAEDSRTPVAGAEDELETRGASWT
jgi:hypothetical protein